MELIDNIDNEELQEEEEIVNNYPTIDKLTVGSSFFSSTLK